MATTTKISETAAVAAGFARGRSEWAFYIDLQYKKEGDIVECEVGDIFYKFPSEALVSPKVYVAAPAPGGGGAGVMVPVVNQTITQDISSLIEDPVKFYGSMAVIGFGPLVTRIEMDPVRHRAVIPSNFTRFSRVVWEKKNGYVGV